MSDATLVFLILGATIALFVSDRLRLDLVALLSLLALLLAGILTPAEALAGFADPIVLIITGLFVVSGGLFRTGVAGHLGHRLGRVAGTSPVRLTAVVMITAGVLSGFMSSTGTVAVMLPVTVSLAWNAGVSPSKLLIPLAFGSLLGGMLTLIGTAPNIVVANQLEAEGLAPFTFFDFTPVGAAMLAAGVGFMLLVGGRMLPARARREPGGGAGGTTVGIEELTRGYALGELTALRVRAGSPLVGRTPAEAEIRQRYGVDVVRVRSRHLVGAAVGGRRRSPGLRAGDVLDVRGDAASLERLTREQGLATMRGATDRSPPRLVEVLLTPRSRLIGQTLAEVRFRDRYGVHVLAIRRMGEVVEEDLPGVRFRFGDTLLVTGSARRIELLRGETGDFVVVAQGESAEAERRLSSRGWIALAIMVGLMGLLTLEAIPAVTAVLLAAVLMVLTRCLDMEAAYRSINWESVVLIAAILPMATALQKTGGMGLIVEWLAPVGAFGPLAMVAALFLITSVLSQVISNTATAVLLAPIAFRAAVDLGVSPYPMLMTVAIAASCAFATPIASPVNTLVLGPGEYRFADFLRVGVALQLLVLLLTLALVPAIFPF